MGRFLSEDPVFQALGNGGLVKQVTGQEQVLALADPQLTNSYSYALNNPVLKSDPQGNCPMCIVGAIILIKAALVALDAYTTYQTVNDPKASTVEKAAYGTLFFAGLASPISGEATAAKLIAKNIGKVEEVAKGITRFISDMPIFHNGKFISKGTVDLGPTLNAIEKGEILPKDVHLNKDEFLPVKPEGYYKEYVHPTPGISQPGAQRIIKGDGGELYYSPDHYKTAPIKLNHDNTN